MAERPALARRSRLARSWGWASARAAGTWSRHPAGTVVVTATLLVGAAVGVGSYLLQSHFRAAYLEGQRLAGWENLLRLGAPWQALVPVGLAAALALIGTARLRFAPAEPPVSWGREPAGVVGQLRQAMRREQQVVRMALLGAAGLVGVVGLRLLVYALLALAGDALARHTLAGVALELGVWLLGWLCFWNWYRVYRHRLQDWGVGG